MEAFNRVRVIRIAIAGLGLLACFLTVLWWLTNFELVEDTYRSGVSLEARRNPYLGAIRFLQESGINVESLTSRTNLYELPESLDTLIVMGLRTELHDKQHEQLMRWIEAGGHLILEATHWWDEETQTSDNRLLDELGVKLIYLEEHYCGCEDDHESGHEEEPEKNSVENPEENQADEEHLAENYTWEQEWEEIPVTLADGKVARVAFLATRGFLQEDVEFKETSKQIQAGHFIQKTIGKGMVSVLSDTDFWRNPQPQIDNETEDLFKSQAIDKQDHAYFLWSLLRGDSRVWLLHSIESPSLPAILWKHFPEAVIGLTALLIVWIWWLRNSFGPLLTEKPGGRRSLLEHLLMTARFEWKADKAKSRVNLTRELIHKELNSKHPKLAGMDQENQCKTLGMLTNVPADQVHFALYGNWNGEHQFIQLTSLIQSIRRKL